MSENLLPNNYSNLDDAMKTANQIRRASVIIKQNPKDYKLFVINNKFTFEDELLAITDVDKNETYININDSYGNIKRKKVILVHDDLKFFARVLRKYNPKPAFFTSKFGDVTLRLKKILAEGTKTEEPVNVSRNGTFDIKPMDLSYRYKKISPKKIKITQKVGEDCYEEFVLDFFISSVEDLNKLAYMLKAQNIDINEPKNEILSGKFVMIELKLKEKVFSKMKYKMFETKNTQELFQIKNPLNKIVLTELSNYDFCLYKSSL